LQSSFFHFGDSTKQDARNLLSSVLIQLCSQSDKVSQVLSSVYSSHGSGSRQPSIDTLLECLKRILTLQGQAPVYIVVDALDEGPNSSGFRTQRREVLEIVKELINLKLPHLHFCVTSRPEIDIRRAFNPLNPYHVSLHNQEGQIKDLAEYIKSVVSSDATMQNWPAMVKELVIDTLAEKCKDGVRVDLGNESRDPQRLISERGSAFALRVNISCVCCADEST